MAENIHEQFMNFTAQGVFKYSSVIIHLFLFQQGDQLHIQFSKQDDKGVNQSVIHWTEIVRATQAKPTFSEFVDSFIHPVK